MGRIFKASRFVPVCILVLASLPLLSQSLKDHLQKGDRYYQRKDYKTALTHFEQALVLDPDNPMTKYKAGVAYVDQKQFQQAAKYLADALATKPDIAFDIHFHLGIAYQNDHQYEEAINQFEMLRGKSSGLASVATRKIAECIAGDSLIKLPVIASVKPVERGINTDFSEFAPLLHPDGQSLIFSSNRSHESYRVKSGVNLDDVYVSRKSEAGWSSPEKISDKINVQQNEVATSISADGTTLFLYYEDGGGDIYTSTMEDGSWSTPVPLNRFINHPQYRESWACISADGNRLFFSSNRPGGRGGFDIYMSERGPNGDWGRPANLGASVNTKGDETSPFFHADGRTLYFSSNGHATLGGHDIFKTRLENGTWSAAENLGYPVNTSAFDGFLVVTDDGKQGYFSSNRKAGWTDSDIYVVTFEE